MADIFLDHTATGTADGSNWANAYTDIVSAIAAMVAGDRLVMAYTHSELIAGNVTLGFALTDVWVITSSVSGVSDVTYTKATAVNVATTGSSDTLTISGHVTFAGVWFEAGFDLKITGIQQRRVFWDSTLKWNRASSGGSLLFNSNHRGSIYLRDCLLHNLSTVSVTYNVELDSPTFNFEMIGGSIVSDVVTYSGLNYIFGHRNSDTSVVCVGVDMSGISCGTLTRKVTSYNIGYEQYHNCILNSNTTNFKYDSDDFYGNKEYLEVVNCSSTDAKTQYFRETPTGIVESDTTVYRVGGAQVRSTPISQNARTSTSITDFYRPHRFLLSHIMLDTSSAKTVTAEFARNDSTTPLTDAEVWLEIEYDDGTSTIAVVDSGRVADITTTPTNQPTSVETWAGLGGTSITQKCSVTTTVTGSNSVARIWFCVAPLSTALYVCPKVEVS